MSTASALAGESAVRAGMPDVMPPVPPMRRSMLIAYAFPAMVVALPTIPVYLVLPTLYGAELGIGLAATGLVLLGARLFDTVSDPLVGALSDRFAFRGYRRKPWIAAGAGIAGIGLYMVLTPPDTADALYLLGWSIVLYGGWTMVAVPYLAWGAELSRNYDERTRITAWREGAGLVGLVGAGVVMATATSTGWSEREAIAVLALAAIAMGLLAFSVLLHKVSEPPDAAASRPPAGRKEVRRSLHDLAMNRPFQRLLAAWFVNGLANGVPAALFFIYLEYRLGADPTQRSVFVLLYFVAAVAAIPLWSWASIRLGKHRAWCWAMAVACLVFALVPLIPAGGFVAFGLVCVVTGAALGADLALPPSIQADVVDYGTWRTGRQRAGLLFSLWSMSTKLALAIAVGTALPAIALAGFDPEKPTGAGLQALALIYALLPAVLKAAAITLVWRFPLTARRHAVIRRAIDRNRLRHAGRVEIPA